MTGFPLGRFLVGAFKAGHGMSFVKQGVLMHGSELVLFLELNHLQQPASVARTFVCIVKLGKLRSASFRFRPFVARCFSLRRHKKWHSMLGHQMSS